MYRTKSMYKRAYERWSKEEDFQLKGEFSDGISISEIVSNHDRNEGAIRARIKKLGLA